MKLYLVKSDIVKARYFFKSEEKATALFTELLSQCTTEAELREAMDDITMKYLETSDEYEITELVSNFNKLKERV